MRTLTVGLLALALSACTVQVGRGDPVATTPTSTTAPSTSPPTTQRAPLAASGTFDDGHVDAAELRLILDTLEAQGGSAMWQSVVTTDMADSLAESACGAAASWTGTWDGFLDFIVVGAEASSNAAASTEDLARITLGVAKMACGSIIDDLATRN